jgi:hypothetical protein
LIIVIIDMIFRGEPLSLVVRLENGDSRGWLQPDGRRGWEKSSLGDAMLGNAEMRSFTNFSVVINNEGR